MSIYNIQRSFEFRSQGECHRSKNPIRLPIAVESVTVRLSRFPPQLSTFHCPAIHDVNAQPRNHSHYSPSEWRLSH
jgi:hypothetical protein